MTSRFKAVGQVYSILIAYPCIDYHKLLQTVVCVCIYMVVYVMYEIVEALVRYVSTCPPFWGSFIAS